MTRKDYEKIAGALASLKLVTQGKATHEQYCIAIANVLQADNERFNKARFLNACGMVDFNKMEF